MSQTTFNSLKKIGYLMRFYRRQQGLSQTEIANEIGISFRNLQRLENGEVEPKLETVAKIAARLNVPISSLIRPTNGDNLFIKGLSSNSEFRLFDEINKTSFAINDDLKLVDLLIEKDKTTIPDGSFGLRAKLDGSDVYFSDALIQLTGVTTRQNNIDNYIAFGSSLERWEYVFRAKLEKAIIQNFYFFPTGFKALEECHYNLKPNPDAPTSECFIRDITPRYELETWMKMIRAQYQPKMV